MFGFGRKSEKDPVCGMEVDSKKAMKSEYNGNSYYFCNHSCHKTFNETPKKYVKK